MNFLYGILSGLVVAIILYGVRYLGASLISLLLGLFVRNISGTWNTEFSKGSQPYQETAKVRQLLSRVWGTIEYKKNGQLRKYKMKGSLRENILVATYEIVSPKTPLDRGSFTLALSTDGNRLEGCYSWTDDESQIPKGDQYVWTRLQQ